MHNPASPTDTLLPALARPAIQSLGGSLIREVANTGMGRADVLPFWFGESDRPTPQFIRDAAAQSLGSGETFYSQNLGRPYLREAIAQYLSDLHGREVSAQRIGAVASGDTGLMLTCQMLLSPGDRVVAVTPLWPNLLEMPRILGAQVERVPLAVRGGRWTLALDRLLDALTPGTRMLILNSPNNPTGWTDLTEGQVQLAVGHKRRLCMVELANGMGNTVFRQEIGVPISLSRTATGRAYLLGMAEDERKAYLQDLQRNDPQRAAWLEQRLTDARDDFARHGFCRSHGDLHREIESIAVPMSQPQDGELWVFAVSVPVFSPMYARLETDLGPRLRTLVRSVESVLGASGLT